MKNILKKIMVLGGTAGLLGMMSLSAFAADPATVKVTIVKYLDGSAATAVSANNTSFPMSATWNATNIGSGTGTFSLGPVGSNNPNPYQATTVDLTSGASYSTSETIPTTCTAGNPYRLVGYSTGTTLANAVANGSGQNTPSQAAPDMTNITQDQFVVVWNATCPPPATTATLHVEKHTTGGDATFSFNGDKGLGAFQITTVGGVGTAVFSNVTPESYQITETPMAGWTQNSSTCSSVTLAAGDNKTCMVSNTKDVVNNTTLKVHILKYLNGQEATAASANNYLFPMMATWQTANLNGGAQASGNYTLGNNSGGAASLYGADTAAMQAPANYSTSEITNNIDASSNVVPMDGTCAAGKYQLQGYKTSSVSFANAATMPLMTTTPAFTSVSNDQYVLVLNTTCPGASPKATLHVEKHTTGGDATFSFNGDKGLGAFQITTVGGVGTAVFSNVTPETYQITETPMAGWTQNSNTCSSVTLAARDNKTCMVSNTKNVVTNTGQISGIKFEDWDGDGSPYEAQWEIKLSGWTIYLDTNNNGALDSGEPSTVTAANGSYNFTGLAAGTYHVREVMQPGWMGITPVSGIYAVTLTAGQMVTGKDFGNFKMGSISGMKFNDMNGNGKKQPKEPGLAGWTINLMKTDGTVIASTVTDANGNYSFNNLAPGKYRVREVQQAGWHQTSKNPLDITIWSDRMRTSVNFGNSQKTSHGNNGNNDSDNDNDND